MFHSKQMYTQWPQSSNLRMALPRTILVTQDYAKQIHQQLHVYMEDCELVTWTLGLGFHLLLRLYFQLRQEHPCNQVAFKLSKDRWSPCSFFFVKRSLLSYKGSLLSLNCIFFKRETNKEAKTFAFTKKEARAVEDRYKHGTIYFSGDGRNLQWAGKGVVPVNTKQCNSWAVRTFKACYLLLGLNLFLLLLLIGLYR